MLKCRAFSHKDASEECSVSNTNILVPNGPVTKEDHYYGYNSEYNFLMEGSNDCKPKTAGGLNVIDIPTWNKAAIGRNVIDIPASDATTPYSHME
ncbi:hypothetical protein H5410_051480 [Solanum commersonii]|uniref:Uncharacterized protein n=1 Tax=Solanum commersonii TaxID=4109 RepID=A0A9J5X046_SOLCO|nr:hypothetical protein H5410_051480 [Solanum commersonii]